MLIKCKITDEFIVIQIAVGLAFIKLQEYIIQDFQIQRFISRFYLFVGQMAFLFIDVDIVFRSLRLFDPCIFHTNTAAPGF